MNSPRAAWFGFALAALLVLAVSLAQVLPGPARAANPATVSEQTRSDGNQPDETQSDETRSDYTQEDCLSCHNADPPETGESSLLISYDRYRVSAHGKTLTCLSCHTGIKDETHMAGEGTPPVNCISCHKTQKPQHNPLARLTAFRIASHGKGDLSGHYGTDNCLGCHQGTGAHGEKEPVTADNCHLCHAPDRPNPMWGKIHSGGDTNVNDNRKKSL